MENFNDSKALAIEIAKILDKKKAHDVRVLKVRISARETPAPNQIRAF